MEKLKCPLRHDGIDDFDCLESGCAWWVVKDSWCSIRLIAYELEHLRQNIDSITEHGIAIDKREE